MLDGVIEVVAVLEPRPVVADGLADDGIENDGQQAAGEAVVIQVNALHRGSGVEHHGGVEEPRHDAEGPAEIARDRGQSGSEQEGELHGALVDIEVHKNAADDHAQHDGGDEMFLYPSAENNGGWNRKTVILLCFQRERPYMTDKVSVVLR